MHKAQRLSRAADLVKAFETFQPLAVRRPDGGWAVGYGHTRTAREGARVSVDDAQALLLYDLMQVAEVVDRDVPAPLAEHQRDALTAFAFNIGWRAFSGSTVVERLNAGDVAGAAEAIGRWDCTQVDGEPRLVDALVQRRAAETLRFLSPPDALLSSSTPMTAPSPKAAPPAPIRAAAPSSDAPGAVEVAILSGSPADRPPKPDAPVDEAAASAADDDEPPPPPVIDAPLVDPPVFDAPVVNAPVAEARPADAFLVDAVPSDPPAATARVLAFAPAIAPVPFPAPRTDDAPAVPSAPPPVSPAPAGAQAGEIVGSGRDAGARLRVLSLRRRPVGLALGLIGAVLFLGALALIAAGPASAWKLLAGLVGVVILTPGAYLLLGPRTSSAGA